MEKIEDQLRQYILAKFLPGETASNLRDDTPLRTSGILDSVATLQLVSFLEEQYDLQIEAYEASVANFDTIDAMASFVRSKIARTS